MAAEFGRKELLVSHASGPDINYDASNGKPIYTESMRKSWMEMLKAMLDENRNIAELLREHGGHE
jgi:hypothetical protein